MGTPIIELIITHANREGEKLLQNPKAKKYHRIIKRKLAGLRQHPDANSARQVIEDLILIAEKSKRKVR